MYVLFTLQTESGKSLFGAKQNEKIAVNWKSFRFSFGFSFLPGWEAERLAACPFRQVCGIVLSAKSIWTKSGCALQLRWRKKNKIIASKICGRYEARMKNWDTPWAATTPTCYEGSRLLSSTLSKKCKKAENRIALHKSWKFIDWIIPGCACAHGTDATSSHESVMFEIFLFRILAHFFHVIIFRVLFFTFSRYPLGMRSGAHSNRTNKFRRKLSSRHPCASSGSECLSLPRFASAVVVRGMQAAVGRATAVYFIFRYILYVLSMTYTVNKYDTQRVCGRSKHTHTTPGVWIMNERDMSNEHVLEVIVQFSKMWQFGQIGFTWVDSSECRRYVMISCACGSIQENKSFGWIDTNTVADCNSIPPFHTHHIRSVSI